MGTFLFVLLNLLLLSLAGANAFASGPALALPESANATQAVTGNAQATGNAPAPTAVQSTVAPVTEALTQTVKKTTAPVREAGGADANKVTAPVAGTIVQSANNTTGPVIHNVGKTATSVSGPVVQDVSKTARPSAGKTVAPVLATAKRTVGKTAGSVLNTATQTVAAVPVLQTAAQTVEGTAAAAGGRATSTIAVIQNAEGATVLVSRAVSPLNLVSSSNARASRALTREPRLLPGPATRIAGAPRGSSPPPPLSDARRYPPAGPLPPKANTPASGAGTTTSSNLSSVQAGTPAGPSFGSPACAASMGPTEEFVESCELASMGRLSSVSFARPLRVGVGAELARAFTSARSTDNSHRATGAPSASSIHVPPAPARGPLPDGSSGAMASATGMAFSIFLVLAGLLLMGGLAAMRLLRLASEPWRKALFVLIPERPG